MATPAAVRAATELEAGISGVQSAMDRLERVIPYAIQNDLATEIGALGAGAVVTSNITKERMIEAYTLGASLIYFLRGIANGSNTIAGTAPMSAAQLKASMEKLGI